MKNNSPLSNPNQPAFKSESATDQISPDSPATAFKSESVKAVFSLPLLSNPNTFIDLAIGRGFLAKALQQEIQGAAESAQTKTTPQRTQSND